MGDIVNLRGVRKQAARKSAEKQAEANRLAFGRTRGERDLAEREKALAARRLDGHELTPPETAGDE